MKRIRLFTKVAMYALLGLILLVSVGCDEHGKADITSEKTTLAEPRQTLQR